MTPDGESAARNRARAIVACADPGIRQLLTSVLSEFRLHPVLPETIDDAKRLIIQEETAIAFVQPRFSDGTFPEVLGAAECPKSPVPVISTSLPMRVFKLSANGDENTWQVYSCGPR